MKVVLKNRFRKSNGKYWEAGQEVDVSGDLLEKVLKSNAKENKKELSKEDNDKSNNKLDK